MADIGWGLNGDIELGQNNDLRITKDIVENLAQDIVKRLQTADADWNLIFPPACANLRYLAGERNERSLSTRIQQLVTKALLLDNIVPANSITMRVFPISRYAVAAVLKVAVPGAGRELSIGLDIDVPSGSVRVGEV